ncbi:probable flavin-containing monoamine oxidase C isoform X1 [Tribolium castaneum]|uniref:probable flavin-containing monoamine oxidase C isoform X1 n=2 Tax=Tribolium castaneum TaxID=7070 RepID=UPI00077DDC5B|nr:PREDICTED: probable flavin-containing monoamine oxidase C isoform X1 [Tribolium castaneum]|eukprot:XP_015839656.1 PREDICTED: probable flavin-containing monoamine oxidase C isoform X1 [Tribolium castaneum]
MIDTYHVLDADVIIIGAGISGLVAAYALLQKEPTLNLLILEATDRIGGRVISKPLIDKNNDYHMYDIGGHWINPQQKEIIELLAELNVNIEFSSNHFGKIIFDYDGKIFKESKPNAFAFLTVGAKLELARFVTKIENLCKKVRLDPDLAATSMEKFISLNIKHECVKALIEWIILKNFGLKTADLTLGFYVFFCTSSHGIANQLDGLNEFWIKDGATWICNKIMFLANLEPIIKARVGQIKTTRRHSEVTTTRGTFYSSYVIVAVPPSEITKIRFLPPLPRQKLEALKEVSEGKLAQFVITYVRPFWANSGYKGDVHVLRGHCSEKPIISCFDVSAKNESVLMGYFLQSEKNPKDAILKQLAFYFGNEALKPLQVTVEQCKSGSPMCCFKSFGKMCSVQENTDRIFWAGAETSTEWYGTICGAVIAGNRAAREVIYSLRPATLTLDDMRFFGTDLSEINVRNRMYDSYYKKLLNPYNQMSAVVFTILMVFVWNRYLKDVKIKKLLL